MEPENLKCPDCKSQIKINPGNEASHKQFKAYSLADAAEEAEGGHCNFESDSWFVQYCGDCGAKLVISATININMTAAISESWKAVRPLTNADKAYLAHMAKQRGER